MNLEYINNPENFTKCKFNKFPILASQTFSKYYEYQSIHPNTCKKDLFSGIYLPSSFKEIPMYKKFPEKETENLNSSFLSLFVIDSNNSYEWGFLKQCFEEGKFWSIGESHRILIPLFIVSNNFTLENIPKRFLPFGRFWTPMGFFIGQAVLKHLLHFWRFALYKLLGFFNK